MRGNKKNREFEANQMKEIHCCFNPGNTVSKIIDDGTEGPYQTSTFVVCLPEFQRFFNYMIS